MLKQQVYLVPKNLGQLSTQNNGLEPVLLFLIDIYFN